MPSKITAAIKQLNHSIVSLEEAIPSMQEASDDKGKQVETLREEYFTAHPEILSGTWDFDMSLSEEHARLTGWTYSYENKQSTNDNGNRLAAALGITDNVYATTIEIPSSDVPRTFENPLIQVSIVLGEIRVDFYNIDPPEVFQFIKEHNITVDVSKIDESISGFKERISGCKERMDNLINAKAAIIEAGLIDVESVQVSQVSQGDDDNLCCHPPLYVEEGAMPPVQFDAEQVSALHKHVGVVYEYLTDVITELHDNPTDVKVVEAMTHALFNVQGELDNIAVEVGDLDRKDEPSDIGMAGSTYWNMLQAAMSQLDDTIDYISEQDFPAFPEVRHRLGRLDTMLYNCCKEFEDNWM